VRDEKTGRVDEYRSDQVDLAAAWLEKPGKALTQADAEFAEDNVLPGAEAYYGTDLEDVEDGGKVPEVPAGSGEDDDEVEDTEEVEDDDDGGELVEAEADDDDPADAGEGMVEIDPETGEPVKYLSEEMEKDFLEFQKWLWQRTGMTIEDMRARAGGVSNG
jgi:hypothetical protein